MPTVTLLRLYFDELLGESLCELFFKYGMKHLLQQLKNWIPCALNSDQNMMALIQIMKVWKRLKLRFQQIGIVIKHSHVHWQLDRIYYVQKEQLELYVLLNMTVLLHHLHYDQVVHVPLYELVQRLLHECVTSIHYLYQVYSLRPFVFCAILRNITLNSQRLKSLIDFQEKLHFNLCRHRKLAAIGVHDLDSITPPFTYTLEAPNSIVFAPLTDSSREYDASELMQVYEHVAHLKVTFFLYFINIYSAIYHIIGK